MIKLSRKEFNSLQEKISEHLFSKKDVYEDLFKELKAAKNNYYNLPWYKKIFTRKPNYKKYASLNKDACILDKIAYIEDKLHDMDDWDINYHASEDDEFFISESDLKFVEDNINV